MIGRKILIAFVCMLVTISMLFAAIPSSATKIETKETNPIEIPVDLIVSELINETAIKEGKTVKFSFVVEYTSEFNIPSKIPKEDIQNAISRIDASPDDLPEDIPDWLKKWFHILWAYDFDINIYLDGSPAETIHVGWRERIPLPITIKLIEEPLNSGKYINKQTFYCDMEWPEDSKWWQFWKDPESHEVKVEIDVNNVYDETNEDNNMIKNWFEATKKESVDETKGYDIKLSIESIVRYFKEIIQRRNL